MQSSRIAATLAAMLVLLAALALEIDRQSRANARSAAPVMVVNQPR